MALGVLVVRLGSTVTPDQFADALWADRPPSSWSKQVQICIGRLRKVLGPDAIVTTAGGYRLTLDGDDVDVCRFERLVDRARELNAIGEHDRAAATYRRALALWRGPPLEGLDRWSPGQSETARLEELRRAVEEEWVAARLDAGEHREVAALAERLVSEEPLRERRWAVLALAQYRCARQVDALRSLARARRLLGELGIDPGTELVQLEAAILRQDPVLATVAEAPPASDVCPYKGLAPYDEADTDVFFGRDAEIDACVERLRTTPLLVVAGPSGCGKSSLVRAGVVPALRRRGVEVVTFTPGSDPVATLAEAASHPDDAVWVVDQFEELFTLAHAPEVQRSVCTALAARAHHHPVVIVIRSDHLGGFSIDRALGDLVERGLHLVSTLTGDALREAIEQPAHLAGLRLEPGLVDLLARDCEGEPGALPLLSHALAETWRRRDGTTLTVEGYESSGGIRAAVARSADRLYDSLPADQRDALRSVLLRLVTPTLDGDPVRCRVPSRSILGDPSRDRVVGLLVRARLVTTERDTFEIAHEALARAWPRLRSWLDDDIAGQRVLRHLVSAADGWDSLGRPHTELYRGARLETALEWRAASSPDLTATESAFLDESAARAESEQRELVTTAEREARTNRRLRQLIGALAVLLASSLIASGVAVRSSRQADRARQAESARGLAAAAISSSTVDPERGVLLGIEAVERARQVGGDVLRHAEEALHGALSAPQLLWRAPETGGGIDWSPDGQHVATEGSEGTGRFDIRDAATGEILRTFEYPELDVTDLEYSPDGTMVAVTDRSGGVRLLDPDTGEELSRIQGPDVVSRSPTFSPDGSMLAIVWPAQSLLRVVDVETGTDLLVTRTVPRANSASWSPDGTQIAAASESEPIGAIIDVASGDTRATLIGNSGPIWDIEWSPDGRSIATAADAGSASIFSADTGEQQIVIPGHGAAVDNVSWKPDSTALATGSADGTVRVWGVVEGGGRALMTLTGDDVRAGDSDVGFAPDGNTLIVGGRNGVTSAWDVGLSAGSEVATLPSAAFFFPAAEFDASGRNVYATGGGGFVRWDTSTWERVELLRGASRPGLVPSSLSDVPFGTPDDAMRIAPSPDGELIAYVAAESVAGASTGRVRVVDAASGAEVFDVIAGTQVGYIAWSPDGQFLAIAGRTADGAFVRVVGRDGATIEELPFGDVVAGVGGFDRSGESLVVWIEPPRGLYLPDVGRVEVWDWRAAMLLRTIEVDPYFAVTSPVDDLVAVGPYDSAPDQSLSIWNFRTGERTSTLEGHSGAPNDMAFSSDGTRLAVAGTDGTTRVWDPRTGHPQLTLGGHLALVSSVSFSPDGSQLATSSADGRVRIWALDVEVLLEIAKRRVTRALTDAECRRYLDQEACAAP
jgi:WD40 repeat protein/DNA-binding SARP family transcriptional activator